MRRRVLSLLIAAGLVGLPFAAQAQQTYVYPQTAGQNMVRWDKFDWQYVDLLTAKDTGAGIRLYYYKNEKDAAERGAAVIEEEYRYLSDIFDYKPQVRIPYIFYNSHGELEQTNLFQIGEATLGVTSPEDLRMTAAYWGDHARFRHVSLHEMTHQFMIQKINSLSEKARAYGSPIQKMPLWFIEGIAEFYSTPGGLDSEAEEYLRDLVANPDPYRGYVLPPFFADEQRSFIYTYKLGQGRVFFLSETYGKDKIQDVLVTSYRMRGWRKSPTATPAPGDNAATPSASKKDRVLEFPELLERVTGDPPEKIQAKWEDWLKRRYFKQYLAATQDFSDFKEVEAAKRYPDSFVVAPDGNAIVYRGIEPVTGQVQLWLIDPHDPISAHKVVEDSRPGADALHYYDRPIAAITEDKIAYVARDGQSDVLRILPYTHSSRDADDGKRVRTRARLHVGGVIRTYDPAPAGLREIGSPVFSPDRKRMAVVGLDTGGINDVWVLDLATGAWRRVTHDTYAEKEIDWGPAGIVVSSDATETRTYNLFLVDPETGEERRITHGSANHRYPRFTPEGDTISFSGDDLGKWDIYLLDVATAKARSILVPPEPPHEVHREVVLGSGQVISLVESSAGQTAKGATTPPASTATATAVVSEKPSQPVAASFEDEKSTGLVRATDFPTGLIYPMFTKDRAFAVGMKGGHFRIFAIDRQNLQDDIIAYGNAPPYSPWAVPTRELVNASRYSLFHGDSWQLEQAFATLGASTGVYGGGFLYFDDKMRDRTVLVTAEAYGAADLTYAQAEYLDRTDRVVWGSQAYLVPQPVIDPVFSSNTHQIIFLEQKFGLAGILEYPFNRFFRVGGSLGVAATNRFIPSFWADQAAYDSGIGFGNDVTGAAAWSKANSGVAPEIDSTFSVGYDTLAQSWQVGPLDGTSVLGSVSAYYQPTRNEWFGQYQIDAEHFFRLYKLVKFGVRGAWGESFGDTWKRPFYVSSVDNLRGVPYYEFNYLIANRYLVGNAELQVPLDGLIRLAIFQNIIGVAAVDAGSVFNTYGDFKPNRTAAYVMGFNFNLAIFQFRLHFAMPFSIGGLVPGQPRPSDGQVIVPNGWVTNFTIRYLFY